MKNASSLLLAAALLTVVSCGNNRSSKKLPTKQPVNPITKSEGTYRATFAPINGHLGDDVEGTATVVVKGDTFTAKVTANNTAASMVHTQSIHVASECPTLSSDANKDGVVDAAEGKASYGAVMVPLNHTLEVGNTVYPMADFTGNYFYRNEVALNTMMEKLKLNEGLNFENKVIVIYGVAANAVVPETVAAVDGVTIHSSLPVACGSFAKIADEEGTNTNGGKEE